MNSVMPGMMSRLMTRRRVLVRVSNDGVLSSMRGGALFVVVSISQRSVPSANADIRFPVGEATDKFLELGMVLDRTDTCHLPMLVCGNRTLEVVLDVLRCLGPCGAEVLHEKGVSFAGRRFSLLLDGDVAASTDDVGNVDEVIAAEAVEGYLGLFAFVAVVEGDDCAGRLVRRSNGRSRVWADGDILVVIPAVDFEGLGVCRFVGDEYFGHDESRSD